MVVVLLVGLSKQFKKGIKLPSHQEIRNDLTSWSFSVFLSYFPPHHFMIYSLTVNQLFTF